MKVKSSMEELKTRHVIDLDVDPVIRLTALVKHFQAQLPLFRKEIDRILASFGIGSWLLPLIRGAIGWYANEIHYLDEMRALAALTAVPLEKIFILQFCYEAYSACTTVITTLPEFQSMTSGSTGYTGSL